MAIFQMDLEICKCFNNHYVYHLNISPSLTTTKEPIMCFYKCFGCGWNMSQDLDLGIMIGLRLRSSNVFLIIGRNRNVHCSSVTQQGPSDASMWPTVRGVKGCGHRKENHFQRCCLEEAQIISKQDKLALIEKQMS